MAKNEKALQALTLQNERARYAIQRQRLEGTAKMAVSQARLAVKQAKADAPMIAVRGVMGAIVDRIAQAYLERQAGRGGMLDSANARKYALLVLEGLGFGVGMYSNGKAGKYLRDASGGALALRAVNAITDKTAAALDRASNASAPALANAPAGVGSVEDMTGDILAGIDPYLGEMYDTGALTPGVVRTIIQQLMANPQQVPTAAVGALQDVETGARKGNVKKSIQALDRLADKYGLPRYSALQKRDEARGKTVERLKGKVSAMENMAPAVSSDEGVEIEME